MSIQGLIRPSPPLCMSEIKTSDYKCWTNTRNHVVSLKKVGPGNKQG